MGCHCGGGVRNLNTGIAQSCNAYFANAYRKTIEKYNDAGQAMDVWSNHIKSFGLGNYLGYDLNIGKKGNIPDGGYYDRMYPDFRYTRAWAARTRGSRRTPTARTTSTSARNRPRARRATGSKPFPGRAGSPSYECTARSSPGSTKLGARVRSSWSISY